MISLLAESAPSYLLSLIRKPLGYYQLLILWKINQLNFDLRLNHNYSSSTLSSTIDSFIFTPYGFTGSQIDHLSPNLFPVFIN